MSLIEPRTLKGFRDYLPEAMMPREQLIATAQAVYRAIDNPNDITVTHEFATLEAAQTFSKLDELKTAMRTGGVLGVPTVWFTNKT